MITVKCPTCGVSYFQADGDGKMTCPHCKTKFSWEDSYSNFASGFFWFCVLGLVGLFIFLACVGAL